MNNFYPNIKPHISPSALASWHNNKSNFIDSYFKGKETKETASMKAGTKIHGLFEGGFLNAGVQFGKKEKEIKQSFRDTGVLVFGKPDDYGSKDGKVGFTDIKSGREVSWTREELEEDVKMRATAWLVWKEMGEPETVTGYILWVGTEWDVKEIIPTKDENMVIKYVYKADELRQFEDVIAKTITDVNKAYEIFTSMDNALVDEDLCQEYAEIYNKIKAIELSQIAPLKEKLDEIKETLSDQILFSGQEGYKCEFGSFFYRSSKKYEYPQDFEFGVEIGGSVETFKVGNAEEISKSLSVFKKNYEKANEPVEEKKSLQFRAKK